MAEIPGWINKYVKIRELLWMWISVGGVGCATYVVDVSFGVLLAGYGVQQRWGG